MLPEHLLLIAAPSNPNSTMMLFDVGAASRKRGRSCSRSSRFRRAGIGSLPGLRQVKSEEEIRGAELSVGNGRQLLVPICEQCHSERQLSAIALLIPVSPLRPQNPTLRTCLQTRPVEAASTNALLNVQIHLDLVYQT